MADPTQPEPVDGYSYFGLEVRHARLHAGMTQQKLAEEVRYQPPYISKVENGAILGSEKFAAACDRVFNTSGFFTRLRARVSEQGHPAWFEPYVKLEGLADSILDYSASLVMGMLQTPEYAHAVFAAVNPRDSSHTIKTKVEARLRRREVMEREDPPLLWVIMHESCLRTRVGGTHVMRDQLDHLLREAESPHVTVQVLPFNAGAPPAAESFTLLTFADRPSVVYADTSFAGQMIDSTRAVENATATYDRLRAAALRPDESLAVIGRIMEESYR